jgi:CubicO group peptidase (beta-lactamase class C family)
VIVVRHGRIVSEAYASPFHSGLRHDLRSVTKSVIATLVAAAIQDGKISGEQKVLAFFPEHRENGPGQEALRVSPPRWRGAMCDAEGAFPRSAIA